VVGVLDAILAKSESGWLVSEKCTYADLIFVPWNEVVISYLFAHHPNEFDIDNYPRYKEWTERLKERPAVKKALDMMVQITADGYAGKYD